MEGTKSKKIISIVLALVFLGVIVGVIVGMVRCSSDRESGIEKIDPNRDQIYVGYFNGGMQLAWINELKYAFEAKYPKYQVIIDPDKDKYSYINLRSYIPTGRQDIYFTTSIQLQDFYSRGIIADLTDVVSTPLTEYGETKSILDKMDPDARKHYEMDIDGNKQVYAIPYFDAMYGFVYDVDLFETKKLFFKLGGGWTGLTEQSLGKDGIQGTFDDGLPITYEDFKKLCSRMVAMGITPVTWAGGYTGYREWFLNAIWASYEGYDDFKINLTFNGTDSEMGDITDQNAYLLQKQSGKKAALTMAYDIANKGKNWASTSAFSTNQSQLTAQTEFLMSNRNGKPVAMLIDGGWWEYEAKGIFDDMGAKYGEDKYGYKKRHFGLMPMPTFIGTPGVPDQTYNGKTLYTPGSTAVIINSKSKRIDRAKEFLRFAHSEEGLKIFTKHTGVVRPYSYDLTDEIKNDLSYFQRNMWELYHQEGVEIVHHVSRNKLQLQNAQAMLNWNWGSTATRIIDGKPKTEFSLDPIHTFRDYADLTIDQFFDGLSATFNKNYWDEIILKA